MLKAGTYRLRHDVPNPRADRRVKHDWRSVPVWKAGDEFLVFEHTRDDNRLIDSIKGSLTPEQIEKIEARCHYSVIQLVGNRWTHQNIGPGSEEQYTALCNALVQVEESHEAMFTRLGVRDYFAKWLVESGRLTPRAFEILHEAYEAEGERPNNEPALQGPRLTSTEFEP